MTPNELAGKSVRELITECRLDIRPMEREPFIVELERRCRLAGVSRVVPGPILADASWLSSNLADPAAMPGEYQSRGRRVAKFVLSLAGR